MQRYDNMPVFEFENINDVYFPTHTVTWEDGRAQMFSGVVVKDAKLRLKKYNKGFARNRHGRGFMGREFVLEVECSYQETYIGRMAE